MSDNDILGITMSGLETGLCVRHIAAFDLSVCDSNDNATQILSNPALKDFDRIPVRENGPIVGVLERKSKVGPGSCKEHMRPLDESLLISADEPLTRVLPLMQDSAYRLVVKGPEIRGIVTRSDIIKLPVRLVAFTLITHLEMVMAEVIQMNFPSEEKWLQLLSPGRQKKVNQKLALYRGANLHLPLLEFTDFCDKRAIIRKLLDLGDDFEEALVSIEELRNTLAHAGSYAQDVDKLNEFLDRLRLAENWTDYLGERLTGGKVVAKSAS